MIEVRDQEVGEKTWKGLSWGKFPYLREFCLSYLKGIKIKNEVWLPSGATPHPRLRTFWFAHLEFTDLNYGPHSMNHPVCFYREYQFVFRTVQQSKPPSCRSRNKWGREHLVGRVSLWYGHSLTYDHPWEPWLSYWLLLIRGYSSAIASPWTSHLPPGNLSHFISDETQRVRIHHPARAGSYVAGELLQCPFPPSCCIRLLPYLFTGMETIASVTPHLPGILIVLKPQRLWNKARKSCLQEVHQGNCWTSQAPGLQSSA